MAAEGAVVVLEVTVGEAGSAEAAVAVRTILNMVIIFTKASRTDRRTDDPVIMRYARASTSGEHHERECPSIGSLVRP